MNRGEYECLRCADCDALRSEPRVRPPVSSLVWVLLVFVLVGLLNLADESGVFGAGETAAEPSE